MEKCERCRLRDGLITLTTDHGNYTFCHPCAIHGGYADVFRAAEEHRDLERMWAKGEVTHER